MSYALIDTTDLTALGNAIRTKTGGTATMAVSAMATAVSGITTGGVSTLPNTYMTYEPTQDEQGRDIINIDFYGKLSNIYTTIDGDIISYPCASLKLWDLKTGISINSSLIYQININIHDNEINYLESDFLRPFESGVNTRININVAGAIRAIGQNTFNGCGNLVNISSVLSGIKQIDTNAFRYCRGFPSVFELPNTIKELGSYCFSSIDITTLILPMTNLTFVADRCFASCSNLTTVYFLGTPSSSSILPSHMFQGNTAITDIYVSWSSGAVTNAPWGATNATIHYDYVPAS